MMSMSAMPVQIISKETIKPSTPTPNHLKTFKISLVDGMLRRYHVPFISYYTINNPNESPADRIKESLAEVLTYFYPLAGRPNFKNNAIICNDKGALFLTARVKCRLADVLKEPSIDELYKLLPPWPCVCPDDSPVDEPTLMSIQLTEFECGNIALSGTVSHLICDAVTLATFLKYWSKISCGFRDEVLDCCPPFPAAEIFPPGNDESIQSESSDNMLDSLLMREGKDTMRRFVFGERAIAALRDKGKSEQVPRPSRVEAVSMFVWNRCLAAASDAALSAADKTSVLNIMIDLRRRMVPPLPEYSGGNIIWLINMITRNTNNVSGMIDSFRTELKEYAEKIVPALKTEGRQDALQKYNDTVVKLCHGIDVNHYIMTSWCRTGITEMDFGWGKPVWVNGFMQLRNIMTLVDGNCGKNIEVWLTLDRRQMIELENDDEFLAFASQNPPVII